MKVVVVYVILLESS